MSMNKEDVEHYCGVLKASAVFEGFTARELEELVGACERKRLAAREALWAVGSSGDAAYILIDGRIEEARRLPPDGQRVDQVSQPGSLLGLAALVRQWDRETTASALEQTELLCLPRQSFEELFDQGHSAAYRLVDEIAGQLVEEMREANRRLHEVFGSPAETLRTLRRRVRKA